MTNDQVIASAATFLNPYTTPDGHLLGDVACTLITDNGNAYSGVCVDTSSGTGFCAERSAIAAMVTAGEYRIAKIVAVWRNEDTGLLHVLPPCGVCRESIRQIDPANIATEVILGSIDSKTLKELIPNWQWPAPIDPK